MTPAAEPGTPSEQDVLDALTRILSNGVLGKNSRHPSLLRYVVTEELAGRGDSLKAYAIGLDVLGRPADFDPNTDGIVRVEFRRLRQALDHYYLTDGLSDPVRITLPSGSYRPGFSRVSMPDTPAAETTATGHHGRGLKLAAAALLLALCIALAVSVLVLRPGPVSPIHRDQAIAIILSPVGNTDGQRSLRALSGGIRDELATSLARIKPFRVTLEAPQQAPAGEGDRLEFHLSLGLQRGVDSYRLVASLMDEKGRLVWGNYFTQPEADALAVQAAFVRQLVQELRPQVFKAAKRELAIESGVSENAWDLYVASTWVPGDAVNSLAWERERIALARRALKLSPQFGQAHSVLADKLAYLANVDPASDTEALRREAEFHAANAIETASDDPDALFNVSLHYWHTGELAKSEEVLRRVVELDPNHVLATFLEELVAYTCTAPPESVVAEARAHDLALAPDNPSRWVTLTWISLLDMNNGNWQAAEEASKRAWLIFRTPDTVLRYAAILARLGKTDAARAVIAQQRAGWPSLDLDHYAGTAMARRCKSLADPGPAISPYRALADALR